LVDEALVGLLDVVELLLLLLLQRRVGHLVRVALEDEFAVGSLDGRGVGGVVEAQGLVVIGRGLVHGGECGEGIAASWVWGIVSLLYVV
jgi:hypothetical protein